ncbi:polysaccharide pyruvyl transferase family protein [Virgibacillus sp. W0181]|uniref:polysaccharide pyruvyl transferase family protein n=1 Tax=Virgibacillus sp. W0181 TaxID=3391581 RepID=UPI003F457689
MIKKRILVDAYFARNLGDDLFLKVLIERYPNVTFHLRTANKNYNILFRSYKNVKIIKSLCLNVGNLTYNLFDKIHSLFLNYKNYDALVIIGGSIFMETKGWEEVLKKREYLPSKFKKAGKKTYILGANFGPFKEDLYRKKYMDFFTKFDDVCFRDTYSFNLFKDPDNIRYAPDIVFNLEKSYSQPKDNCIGFSIIDIQNRNGLKEYQDKYIEKIGDIIKKCVELGHNIKLFSFCEREGDIRAIKYLLKSLDSSYKKHIQVVNYGEDIDSFLYEFESCMSIVGIRFHSIILGLLFDQPVFPIVYSDKTFNALEDLKIESDCSFIKNIEDLEIEKVIKVLLNNRLNNRRYLSEAANQFERLDKLLL